MYIYICCEIRSPFLQASHPSFAGFQRTTQCASPGDLPRSCGIGSQTLQIHATLVTQQWRYVRGASSLKWLNTWRSNQEIMMYRREETSLSCWCKTLQGKMLIMWLSQLPDDFFHWPDSPMFACKTSSRWSILTSQRDVARTVQGRVVNSAATSCK